MYGLSLLVPRVMHVRLSLFVQRVMHVQLESLSSLGSCMYGLSLLVPRVMHVRLESLDRWRPIWKCPYPLPPTPSTFQAIFTFTLPPGSSPLLHTPEYSESEYHSSLTRLQLPGTSCLFLCIMLQYLCQVFQTFVESLFSKTFSPVPLP